MKKTPLKGNFAHILFLIALLAVILAIMIYLKTGKSGMFVPAIPEFKEPVKMIGLKYYNRVYHFGISLPSNDWEIDYPEQVDSLRKQDPSLSLLDNIDIMVKMYRRDKTDTLAIVEVGIIDLVEPRTPNSLAEQNLNELRSTISATDTFRVIKDVTLSSSASLKGAYYVIEFTESFNYKYPLWVAIFIVRNKLAFTIFCKSRSEAYALLRTDFETILKSFRLYK